MYMRPPSSGRNTRRTYSFSSVTASYFFIDGVSYTLSMNGTGYTFPHEP